MRGGGGRETAACVAPNEQLRGFALFDGHSGLNPLKKLCPVPLSRSANLHFCAMWLVGNAIFSSRKTDRTERWSRSDQRSWRAPQHLVARTRRTVAGVACLPTHLSSQHVSVPSNRPPATGWSTATRNDPESNTHFTGENIDRRLASCPSCLAWMQVGRLAAWKWLITTTIAQVPPPRSGPCSSAFRAVTIQLRT